MKFCRIRTRGLALVVSVVASFFPQRFIGRHYSYWRYILANAENWWLDQQKQLLPFLQITLTSCLIIYWSEIIFFLSSLGQIFTMIFEVKCLRQISQMRHLRGVVILFILRQEEKVSIFWLFRMGRCSSTIICGGQSASSISLYSKTTTMSQSGLWSLLGLSRCFWRVTSRGYCTCWQLENSPVIGTLINEPKKKKKKESMLCIINIILSCSWLKLMWWWLLKDEMKAVKSTA